MSPPTFPLRPINGGRLELAPKKFGTWLYQPKYNGWRATIHVPTGQCWNRHGQPLSIGAEFATALAEVRRLPFEWLDCEGLERRHTIGRGTLIVLDCLDHPNAPLDHRMAVLEKYIEHHPLGQIAPHRVFMPGHVFDSADAHRELYAELARLNTELRAEVYEGLVAKRADSLYPFQLGNAERTFHHWMKHRFIN